MDALEEPPVIPTPEPPPPAVILEGPEELKVLAGLPTKPYLLFTLGGLLAASNKILLVWGSNNGIRYS
jgi:hypothetical protein